jgi:CO dehydrogenase/acetyl-CoA synthase beta subunit
MATMTDYDKIQKEIEHYRQIFGTDDVATKAYRSLVKMLNQQIDILNEFSIKSNLEQADKKYDRVIKMFNEMPDMILSLKDLKDKIGVEYVEKAERQKATSPQSIGLLKNGTNV